MDLVTLGAYLSAIVVFGVYSSMYKENPIYAFIEHAMIGISAANLLVVGWTSITRNIVKPIGAGDLWPIIPALIGLSYFTIFHRRLSSFYRSVVALRLGSMLGVEAGMSITVSVTQIIAVSQGVATDLSMILAIVTIILILFYFTFSKKTEEVFRIPRRVGRWAIFLFYAANIATLFGTRLDAFVGLMFKIALSPALVLIPIIVVLLLVDIFIGWKRIFGLQKTPTEQKSPS